LLLRLDMRIQSPIFEDLLVQELAGGNRLAQLPAAVGGSNELPTAPPKKRREWWRSLVKGGQHGV